MSFLSFWDKHPSDTESVVGKSMTIPDQSLSVRDILMRFTRGQMDLPPIDIGDDDDFDTPIASDFGDMVDAFDEASRMPDIVNDIRLQSTPQVPPEDSSPSDDSAPES